MLDLSLAVGHHLLIFAIFGIICAEVWAVRPGLNSAAVARIASLDLWYGILAAAILVVGFCRAIFSAKGWAYYSHNAFFWAKLGTFAIIGLLPVPVSLDPAMRAARETVSASSTWIRPLQQEMARVIVGQRHLLDRLLIALLTNGHVLLEGVPGLAKTLALKTLASCIALHFKRLQFTPDMLPADIVGTMIYNPQDGAFRTKHGPIFSNLILADEINRAPAKAQSALLEAMP